jgi:acetate kinase
MRILVINVGSTSLKYAILDPDSQMRYEQGIFDRLGQPDGDAANAIDAIEKLFRRLADSPIDAIGYRVVHGGDCFQQPTLVNGPNLELLSKLDQLAPLHNPPARRVIEYVWKNRSSTPQYMVFDTSFFGELPPVAYRYAIPESWLDQHQIRRYGAHGTSHEYLMERASGYYADRDMDPMQLRLITLHLGGGASAAAVRGNRPIDTSMGLTPMEGLVMGTRCGDIDPGIILYMLRNTSRTVDDLDRILNKESGLLGLCGESDIRRVLERVHSQDPSAMLAIDIYVRRIQKTIGSYFALLGGLDVLVFSAGVGENSPEIRSRVIESLGCFGCKIDAVSNQSPTFDNGIADITFLSPDINSPSILVIKTDEELAIARKIAALSP